MLSPGGALVGAGLGKHVALVTDGRFSGASHGMCGNGVRSGSDGDRVCGGIVVVGGG